MNTRKVLAVASARRLMVSALSAAATLGSFLPGAPVASAVAEPCPDVEVVFARGSGEAPGVGGIGQPFIDALRSQIGAKSLTVYPVNYPASTDFSNPDFPSTVIDGIRDASSHIESMAANCPNTKEVLGGYSQGAAVAGYTTSAAVPPGVPASAVPPPMPPDVAKHVAAVALFGTPSGQFLHKYNAPPLTIGPLYQPKTLQLCAQGDPICGPGNGDDGFVAHTSYPVNGMTSQAANFASSHL
ncbi:cutinase family protein [Mycobacterium sp. 1465703.0]|uniref:cutinase family protein n=1 Tax=Mycobacterium sp. 1465703.0 TaxID=1834078 RepID=UPI0007FE386F|nr:cutinase family protein [Mycobacterium sp. 1465703.0]OBI97085.1 cutinase [Mycobacterium sp. 1465703.0]